MVTYDPCGWGLLGEPEGVSCQVIGHRTALQDLRQDCESESHVGYGLSLFHVRGNGVVSSAETDLEESADHRHS